MTGSDQEFVTKAYLVEVLTEFKAELKAELKAEMRVEMQEQLQALKYELLERTERVETTLLNEFRKWAVRLETRVKVHDIEISSLNDRMSFLEDRGPEPEKA